MVLKIRPHCTQYQNRTKIDAVNFFMFYSTKINALVFLLDIIIKAGKYFPIISISLASLNFLLAVNNFLANNIWFGILNSLFAISGLIFLAQMHQMKKDHEFTSNHKIKREFLSNMELK